MEKMEIITIPDGQTKIEKGEFRWRKSLYSINIPESVTSIGKSAFYECLNLQSIIIPDSVAIIEKNAFYGCKKLQNITMSENITSIGDYAFYGCKNLISIILPDSVASIGNYAFSWCRNLTVYCSGSQKLVEAYCKKNKIKLQFTDSAQTEIPDISEISEKPVLINGRNTGISNIEKRINAFINEIDLFENSVSDTVFSNDLIEIKNTLDKIIVLWKEDKNNENENENENRSKQLDGFAGYYFPVIKKILDTYSQIENQNLNGESAVETKQRISRAIPFIKKAFEKQLENICENKMLDITTDIDVLEAMLAMDGLKKI